MQVFELGMKFQMTCLKPQRITKNDYPQHFGEVFSNIKKLKAAQKKTLPLVNGYNPKDRLKRRNKMIRYFKHILVLNTEYLSSSQPHHRFSFTLSPKISIVHFLSYEEHKSDSKCVLEFGVWVVPISFK